MKAFRASLCIGLIAGSIVIANQAEAELLDQWLDCPPAFHALYGNPEVVIAPVPFRRDGVAVSKVGNYSTRNGFSETPQRSFVRVRKAPDESRGEVQRRLARSLAERFYLLVLDPAARGFNERKLNMVELIHLDLHRFLEIAEQRLTGGRAAAAIENDWWDVRMGNALTPGRDHHLVAINLHYDHKDKKSDTVGHFCFALRERGGDPHGDVLFDFRAPWYVDREPRNTEAINIHNRLKLSAFSENLYDWIYTQTEYRHCFVRLWFLPVAEEQIALLRHFEVNHLPHAAGNFRAFRKNCASLGLRFYDRTQPLTNPAPQGGMFADMPILTATRIVERYEAPMLIEIPNVTDKRGRKPTAKSKVHRAKPSRRQSAAFQILAADPRVN